VVVMHRVEDRRRQRAALASWAGSALRIVDQACGWAYVAGTLAIAAWLGWLAVSVSPWLWLMVVPVFVTAALLATGLWRHPDLGLHVEWPFDFRVGPRK